MSTPLLSQVFSHYFGTPHDFIKLEKKPLEAQLAKLASISIHPNTQKGQFIYPIIDDSQVYVRLSTLTAMREHCADILDTLPDGQEGIIREFLVYSEGIGRMNQSRQNSKVVFLTPAALKPL